MQADVPRAFSTSARSFIANLAGSHPWAGLREQLINGLINNLHVMMLPDFPQVDAGHKVMCTGAGLGIGCKTLPIDGSIRRRDPSLSPLCPKWRGW